MRALRTQWRLRLVGVSGGGKGPGGCGARREPYLDRVRKFFKVSSASDQAGSCLRQGDTPMAQTQEFMVNCGTTKVPVRLPLERTRIAPGPPASAPPLPDAAAKFRQ